MKKLTEYIQLTKEQRQEHINLDEDCIIRGGMSTHFRGILAHYLDTDLNTQKIDCCHACNNEACCNPKHLYWGTRSENVLDSYEANPDIKNKLSSNMLGKKNPNYDIKPWRNVAIKTHANMLNIWKSAEYIYKNYFEKGWDFSKYGQGETFFEKKYGYSRASIKKMWKMFSKGWNPYEDQDFQRWVFEIKESRRPYQELK